MGKLISCVRHFDAIEKSVRLVWLRCRLRFFFLALRILFALFFFLFFRHCLGLVVAFEFNRIISFPVCMRSIRCLFRGWIFKSIKWYWIELPIIWHPRNDSFITHFYNNIIFTYDLCAGVSVAQVFPISKRKVRSPLYTHTQCNIIYRWWTVSFAYNMCYMPNIHNNCLAVTACNRINEMNTCNPMARTNPSPKRNSTKVPFYLIISKLDHQFIVIMVRYVWQNSVETLTCFSLFFPRSLSRR